MDFLNQLGNFFSSFGEQVTYYNLIFNIDILKQQGNFEEAIVLGEQSLNLARKIWGNEHPNFTQSLIKLTELCLQQGKQELLEPLLKEMSIIAKRLFSEDDQNVVIILTSLAAIYHVQGKYSEAEPLYQQALQTRKRLVSSGYPDVLDILNNLFALYFVQGKYSEAEPFYQQILAIKQRLSPGDNSDVADSLSILSNLYYIQGKYSEAEPLYQQALEMRKRLFPGDNSDVADSLSILSNLYYIQGKYSEAEPLDQQVLAIKQRLSPGDNSDVADSLNNLGNLYHAQGKYSEAEHFQKQALEMTQRLFKGEHPDLARSLSCLGNLYYAQGKYSDAESLYQQALEMTQRLFKGAHPDVAISLNNLAVLYANQGKYSEAESLYQQVLEISQRLFPGDAHPAVVSKLLNNVAATYAKQGKYSKAEPLHQQALEMTQRLFKGAHPDVTLSLNNLGYLYHVQRKYSDAESLYQQALEMRQRLFPGAHPDVALSLNNLAVLHAVTNHPKQALEKLKEATEVQHRLISQEFVGSSENDRMRFLDNIRTTQYALLSLVYQYYYPLEESEEKSQAIYTALDLILKRKALSNAASAAFNAAMYSDRYSSHLKQSFQTWRERWQQIINLQSSLYLPENLQRLEPNQQLLNQLYREVETLEKNITAQVPELRLENQFVDRQAIALELPENSTLIEYVYFPVYDFTTQKYQNPRYLAFILPAKQPDKVQMFDLGEADKIDDLIRKVRQAVSQLKLDNMGISTKTWKPETAEPQNPFIELTTTIFKPLQNHLQGQQLFICPDAALTLIPFEILPLDPENHQLLIDQYHITYLTAGRDLLRHQFQPQRTASESLVMADPNFDLSVNEAVAIAPNPTQKPDLSINLNSLTHEIIATLGKEDNKPFSPVPQTRQIAELFATQFQVNPLFQNQALKTYLTNGKCPQKLLLATHGFFLQQNHPPQPDLLKAELIQPGFRSRQIETTENPLLRSGLALAGANTWLLGGEMLPETGEGIVFAQDVAGFDLWATELIILIACQTAIGDVKNGEGVKGLRSAFTAAGARILIMSLWSVPTQVSILLMNRFFANLNHQKLSSQQALKQAQNYIRTMTWEQLESLPAGQQIIQEIRIRCENKPPELLQKWQSQPYPLQDRYFWGAWVCVGREF